MLNLPPIRNRSRGTSSDPDVDTAKTYGSQVHHALLQAKNHEVMAETLIAGATSTCAWWATPPRPSPSSLRWWPTSRPGQSTPAAKPARPQVQPMNPYPYPSVVDPDPHWIRIQDLYRIL